MKYIYTLLLLTISIVFNSCNTEDLVDSFSNKTNQVTFSAPDFKYSNESSRTTIDIDIDGAKFCWSANDTIGIFPDEGRQVDFPMTEGAGTNTATFTGGGWALKASSTYAAYYPIQGKFYLNKKNIPLSYYNQIQDGNNTTAHLGNYDYMGALASIPENGNVNFQFKHLGALVRLNIPIKEACTLNSVILHSNQEDFITKASLDLTSTTLKVTPVEKSNQYEIKLNNLTLSESDQTATIFFMLSPIDLSERNIDILVKSEHADYQYEFSGKNFKEGIAYSINAVPTDPASESDNAMILVTRANFSNNFTAHLPKLYGSDITIDWGDGTIDSNTPSLSGEHYTHQYSASAPTDFEIKITGNIDSLNSQKVTYYTITEIKQWGKSKLKGMRYAFYKQPLKSIAEDTFGALQNITDFSYAFSDCTSLTTIASGLFSKAHNAKSFYRAFYNCNTLASIPAELFENCPNTTTFNQTFSYCQSLTTLPSGLFGNNPNVTDFYGTFYRCTSLEDIPSELFNNCPNVIDFGCTFYVCTSLAAIPSGLFDNCLNVTSFETTFNSCEAITTIPSGLFDNCPNVTSFKSTFYNCNSLETIPSGLFNNCSKVIDFGSTFGSCEVLASIPSGLFDNNPNVTTFKTTFYNGTSLKTIPSGLFDNCPNVTSFEATFSSCENLESVPTDLFDNNRRVQSFNRTFWSCSNLKGESPYTTINGVKYHLYERGNNPDNFVSPTGEICFYKCNGLSDYLNIPFKWKEYES